MTEDLAGSIGIGVLIVAAVVLVIEAALAARWGLATAKRMQLLQERVESGRVELGSDVKRLRATIEETRRLWQPYRRALRWLNHPLAIALLGAFRRRVAVR